MPKIMNIVGARPNFMKIAPIIEQLDKNSIGSMLVHTGQHYSANMSDAFFRDLKIPKPDINLDVGSSTNARQTADIMLKLEAILMKYRPSLVVVVGDVNSTLAAALAASKLGIKIAHVESGLRSFDDEMPEELNRRLTDHISNLLFCTERSAVANLKKEGIEKNVFFTGNVMIDTLVRDLKKASKSQIIKKLDLKKNFCTLTVHRPENTDNREKMAGLLKILEEVQKDTQVVYPVHPRTKKMLEAFGLYSRLAKIGNVKLCEPLGYLDFLCITKNSEFVITDSGGLQEETSFLNVPCITVRKNTERPITVEMGSNTVTGMDKKKVIGEIRKIKKGLYKKSKKIDLWDGKAAERIVNVLKDQLNATTATA